MSLGGGHGRRALETLLGAGVGILINLLAPPHSTVARPLPAGGNDPAPAR